MATTYEWTIETLDGDDVIDNDFSDTFPGPATDGQRVGLVQSTGNATDMLTDRQWAYLLPDGTLPQHFDNGRGDGVASEQGAKVPARFHREVTASK